MPREQKGAAAPVEPVDDPQPDTGAAVPEAEPVAKPAAKKTAPARAKASTGGIDLTATAENTLADAEEHINGLWWGREGGGKTTDVLTAANRGRVLVVNAEGGIKKRPLREFGIDLDSIVPWPPRGREDELTIANLESLAWQIRAQLQADPNAWYAVVWDSITEIYEVAVGGVRAAEFEKNANAPVAKQKEYRNDPYFTDISDYGTATAQMRHLLRLYRDLPCHFLVTALERRDVDDDTGKVQYGPAVGPAFQKDLLGYMDITINAEATELRIGADKKVDLRDEFTGRTRSDGLSRAKDRLKALPRFMPVPTFERVVDYVEDRITEDSDPLVKDWHEARTDHAEWIEKDREATRAARAAARGGRK
jgi:hypothetical protein